VPKEPPAGEGEEGEDEPETDKADTPGNSNNPEGEK